MFVMPFLDILKKGATMLGQALGDQIRSDYSKILKMKNDADVYQEKYESLSDEELLRKFRNSSGAQKAASGRLLKARGYYPKND